MGSSRWLTAPGKSSRDTRLSSKGRLVWNHSKEGPAWMHGNRNRARSRGAP
ncbi:hypothetical protein ACFPRL_24880 [Pseudoclavibacter helvolus]